MDVISSFMPQRRGLFEPSQTSLSAGPPRSPFQQTSPWGPSVSLTKDGGSDEPLSVIVAPGGAWVYEPSSVSSLSPIRPHDHSSGRRVHDVPSPAQSTDAIRGQLSPSRLITYSPASSSVRRDTGIASALAARSPHTHLTLPDAAVKHHRHDTPAAAESSALRIRVRDPVNGVTPEVTSGSVALDHLLSGSPPRDRDYSADAAKTTSVVWVCVSCPLQDCIVVPLSHPSIRFCPQCGSRQPGC